MITSFLHKVSAGHCSVLAAFLCLLVLLPRTGHCQTIDRVVAVVNDDIITLSELNEKGGSLFTHIQQNEEPQQVEQTLRQAQARILNSLIEQRLFSQAAGKANITISEGELATQFERKVQQLGLNVAQLEEELKKSSMSMEQFKENIRFELLKEKLFLATVRTKVVITDQMIKDYYESEYAHKMAPGGYYLLQIGILRQEGQDQADREDDSALKKATEVRDKLMEGADFGTMARKYSDLPTAEDGGALGVFQEEELAPYMREAIINLEPGEISDIITTPESYQIFKLLSRQQDDATIDQVPLETVKEDIRRKLYADKIKQEFNTWLGELKQSAYIDIML